MIKRFWAFLAQQLGATGRLVLTMGALAIVLTMAVVGYWLTRSDYQVLFSDLAPQDTAAMVAELERLKIPYVLSGQADGREEGHAQGHAGTILVERSDVYKTRIKLMGRDIPLHGAVGFELFNNSDIGMTEFAQKINYQRALQGELTRTILSLAEIRDARVLLALPDQSLFKQAASKPKASITLTLKQTQSLRPDQVAGIQRLVAAAVPAILAQDVTIVDQSGVALTRAGADAGDIDSGAMNSRLDLKRDTENYLSRKAMAVLEKVLGAGQALASVDVTLNMDRVQSSTDEVVGAPSKSGGTPTGVVVRERETVREAGAPLNGSASSGAGGGHTQRELEYALGRRVEQVTSQPGSIRRIQVAVVVRKDLPFEQQEQLRKMVAASVGASLERGDTVVLQAMEAVDPLPRTAGKTALGEADSLPSVTQAAATRGRQGADAFGFLLNHRWISAALIMLVLCMLVWRLQRGRAVELQRPPVRMSDAQRQEALRKVREWMHEPAAKTARPGSAPPEVAGVRAGRETR